MLRDCYIIILASGMGKRFGKSVKMPKQLINLAGKPILCYSLETAISLAGKDRVILTYPKGMLKQFSNLLRKYDYDVMLVEGGERRQDSVYNAISIIKNEKSVVLIHDSARPLATKELFKRVYDCAKLNGAAIPVVMATETVKEVSKGIVKKTLDRKHIGFSQTPQGFKLELLKRVIDVSDFDTEYTDEAMLLESHGIKVHTVEGERLNLKLTFEEDLDIIKSFAEIIWKKE
ncbi:MAG: hypothetical protein OHK0040_03500 [bacterium]